MQKNFIKSTKMEKKKILIATDNFLPRWDGIARFLVEIVPKLKNYNITIVAPDFGPIKKDLFENVKLIRFPLRSFSLDYYTPAKPDHKTIKKLVSQSDLVWSQTIGPIGAATINTAKKMKKKIIAYTHSVEWELVPKGIKRGQLLIKLLVKKLAVSIYNKCDLLLVPSKEIADIFTNAGIKTKKRIVRLGVDLSVFKPIDKNKAKKSIGFKEKDFIIGYYGRTGNEKNLETLEKAFNIVSEKNKNVKLLIVGGKTNIKNCTNIEKTDYGYKYLQAMDIYVLPSLVETSSLTTMEAMACGCAVITTPVGLVKDYIQNGYNGVIFRPNDYEMLAKKINNLINDKRFREKIGKNARLTAQEMFSWGDTIKDIKNIFSEFFD